MKLIQSKAELIENIDTVEGYLTEGSAFEMGETIKLIKRGTCFIAYQVDNEIRFAPSRFLGYRKNQLSKHKRSHLDGRETNKAINEILNVHPAPNASFEIKYISYCKNLGIEPNKTGTFGVTRKYWLLDMEQDFQNNEDLTGDFPEGKIVERKHKARERNPKVVEIAKESFRRKHGRLFCQACNFDFEKVYGEIGEDLIEGHHIIPVSEMKPDHKTKPEDIALLCSNCHRVIHRRRPWLRMEELKKIVKKK